MRPFVLLALSSSEHCRAVELACGNPNCTAEGAKVSIVFPLGVQYLAQFPAGSSHGESKFANKMFSLFHLIVHSQDPGLAMYMLTHGYAASVRRVVRRVVLRLTVPFLI